MAYLLPPRHDAFKDLMLGELAQQQYMTFTFITGSSVGEELGKSINNVSHHIRSGPCTRSCQRCAHVSCLNIWLEGK
jgi:hypothetical protein